MIGYEGTPRYAKAIQSLTGDEEIAPPGLTLESDRPEYSALKRERLWTLLMSLNALAANFNKFMVAPTIGSNTISVITHIWSTVDAWVSIAEAVVAGGAAIPAVARDARLVRATVVPRRMQTVGFTAQGAALTGNDSLFRIPANIVVVLPPFITAPDNNRFPSFLVQSTVINVAQAVTLAGYERSARIDELADM